MGWLFFPAGIVNKHGCLWLDWLLSGFEVLVWWWWLAVSGFCCFYSRGFLFMPTIILSWLWGGSVGVLSRMVVVVVVQGSASDACIALWSVAVRVCASWSFPALPWGITPGFWVGVCWFGLDSSWFFLGWVLCSLSCGPGLWYVCLCLVL